MASAVIGKELIAGLPDEQPSFKRFMRKKCKKCKKEIELIRTLEEEFDGVAAGTYKDQHSDLCQDCWEIKNGYKISSKNKKVKDSFEYAAERDNSWALFMKDLCAEIMQEILKNTYIPPKLRNVIAIRKIKGKYQIVSIERKK